MDRLDRKAVLEVVERAIERCCLLGERVMLAEVATEIRALPAQGEEGRLRAALEDIANGCTGRVDREHLACRVARTALTTEEEDGR